MTPEEASVEQIERWCKLSLEERLRMAFAMIEDGFLPGRRIDPAAHPEYTPRSSERPGASGSPGVEALPLDWNPW